jgi:uncharacterized membrane protein YqjE
MAEPDQSGLFHSLRRLPVILASVLRNRLELLAVEWQEERLQLFGTLLLLGAILAFSVLALAMLTIVILIGVGPGHRLAAAGVLTGIYVAGALIATAVLRKRLRNWSAFDATRRELEKDCEWLEHKENA